MRLIQARTAFVVVLFANLTVTGCKGSSKSSPAAQPDPSAATSAQTGALAVGTAIVAELNTNLVTAGLTQVQATVVIKGASDNLNKAVGTIAVDTASLVDTSTNSIAVIAPAITIGAMATLAIDAVGLSDFDKRAAIVQAVMNSTVSSLGGRLDGLKAGAVLDLQGAMVGGGVAQLPQAGFAAATTAKALRALTTGATSALVKAGTTSDNAPAAASAIINGAISNLKPLNVANDQLASAFNAMVGGVVSSLAKAGVASANVANAAGTVTESSVTGLKVLNLASEQLLTAMQGTASGAVGGLNAAGVEASAVGAAAQKIAAAAVGALSGAGVSQADFGSVAGAVAAGAIQGMDTSGLTAAQIVSTNAISAIVNGTASALATSGLKSSDVGAALGKMAAAAVGAMANSSLSAGDSTLKNAVLKQVISGSTDGVKAAGLASTAAVTALVGITQSVVEALPQAGFAAADRGQAAASALGSALSVAVAGGLSSSADAPSLASSLGAGVGTACTNAGISISTSTLNDALSTAATNIGLTDSSSLVSKATSGISSTAPAAVTTATTQYIITSSGDAHETIAPSASQKVNSGSTLALTVTANSGYSVNSSAGGTCPAGTWSGSIYTTGTITANCTIAFTAAAETLVYVPFQTTNSVHVYTRGGTLVRTITSANMSQPDSVAVDADGNVYVLNYGNDKIIKYGPGSNTELLSITTQHQPFNISISSVGDLYVAGQNKFIQFDSAGNTIRTVPSGTSGPWQVAADANFNVYAAMNINNTNAVYTYGPTGTTYTNRYSGSGYPYGIAIDASGNYYTANLANNTVTKFSATGTLLLTITPVGGSSTGGVSVDSNGHIYIGDDGLGIITEYAADGTTVVNTITGLDNTGRVTVR